MRSVLLVVVVWVVSAGMETQAQHLPAWRGPSHNGVSAEKGLPDTWSATCAATATPGADANSGGPSADETSPLQRGGQRPGGGNFEGRPLVATVCEKIETRNIAWKLPLPAYSGSTPII